MKALAVAYWHCVLDACDRHRGAGLFSGQRRWRACRHSADRAGDGAGRAGRARPKRRLSRRPSRASLRPSPASLDQTAWTFLRASACPRRRRKRRSSSRQARQGSPVMPMAPRRAKRRAAGAAAGPDDAAPPDGPDQQGAAPAPGMQQAAIDAPAAAPPPPPPMPENETGSITLPRRSRRRIGRGVAIRPVAEGGSGRTALDRRLCAAFALCGGQAGAPPRIALLVTGLRSSRCASRRRAQRLAAAGQRGLRRLWTQPARRRVARPAPTAMRSCCRSRSSRTTILPWIPGPHTLLTTLPPEENLKRLQWLMSRYTGYVGVTNHMGAKFEATRARCRRCSRS